MFDIKMVGLKNEINKKLGDYNLEVGILVDKPEREPIKEQKNFHGGPANKAGKQSDTTVGAVLEAMDAAFNLLLGPWAKSENRAVAQVIKDIIVDMNDGKGKKRIEAGGLAVVRNPIMRGDYGQNKPQTAKAKGFNRLLINTGTLFNNIKARLVKRV